ncbi:MAG: ribulose-phosphate 3-epimerase [Lachnospiraceae bacterium]|nr:ribulose-phosphate 3-epimerase [Lachnospiraceae bacterium]
MNCLAPSILSADFGQLGTEIQTVDEAGAQYLHFDVMDGHFVPEITYGIPVLKSVRKYTDRILDVHLMVDNPEQMIPSFIEAGADIITVHAESCVHLDRVVHMIKEGNVLAGVALCPATPISVLENILPELDMVLIMTVNPGYGGQTLIPYTLDKVRNMRQMIMRKGLNTDIEVDGGINLDNVSEALDAGANIIVAGSGVFRGDAAENVTQFLEIMR